MADAIQVAIRKGGTIAQAPAPGNELAEQICAQGLPPYSEMVRKGQGWSTMATSAVAGLVVRPTDTPSFEIFNAYPLGGKTLIVDRIFSHCLVGIAAADSFCLWAAVASVKAAVATGSFVVRGSSGKPYSGPVICAASTTIALAQGWFPWATGGTAGVGAALPMSAAIAEVAGRLIVPPQCSLCLAVVSTTTAMTFCSGASWFEEYLSNE
jgi:hypothetical protein